MNARIADASIFIENHGMLTFMLDLTLENGTSQGYGGYNLACPGTKTHGANIIYAVLKTVGVDDWADLRGKIIRIKHNASYVISEIGNPLDDCWLNIEAQFNKKEE